MARFTHRVSGVTVERRDDAPVLPPEWEPEKKSPARTAPKKADEK